jgi:hypothetical protein
LHYSHGPRDNISQDSIRAMARNGLQPGGELAFQPAVGDTVRRLKIARDQSW